MLLPLHPAALDELVESVSAHERERAGSGERLFSAVRTTLVLAAMYPRSGRVVVGFAERFDVRLFVVPRFRYVVVTALVREERHVIAVAHTRRDPTFWHDRVR